MPPKPLIDLNALDFDTCVADQDAIRECNKQRYEMEHLNSVIHLDLENHLVVGYKDVTDDEFWVRGHIPGRPLLPGVIMCEAAAQLCSYYFVKATETDRFLGFAGLNDVKFRRSVEPGQRLVLIANCTQLTARRATFDCQGFVEDTLVFEGTIVGMPL